MRKLVVFVLITVACGNTPMAAFNESNPPDASCELGRSRELITNYAAERPTDRQIEPNDARESESESEAESESESESEDGVESESEAESESESEPGRCEASETCGDELDNDCDGWIDCNDLECGLLAECRHCHEIRTGWWSGWVRGAPTFELHSESPRDTISPGLVEVMRIVVGAENNPECASIMITEIPVLIWFVDNAGTGWRPRDAEIRDTETGQVLTHFDYDEAWEEYRYFNLNMPIVLEPGTPRTLSVWVDTNGATPGDDWLQAELASEVYWQIFSSEDATEYADYLDIFGELLFF